MRRGRGGRVLATRAVLLCRQTTCRAALAVAAAGSGMPCTDAVAGGGGAAYTMFGDQSRTGLITATYGALLSPVLSCMSCRLACKGLSLPALFADSASSRGTAGDPETTGEDPLWPDALLTALPGRDDDAPPLPSAVMLW